MGVRGTDYFVKVTPALGETELIVFDGTVNIANSIDKKDAKNVK